MLQILLNHIIQNKKKTNPKIRHREKYNRFIKMCVVNVVEIFIYFVVRLSFWLSFKWFFVCFHFVPNFCMLTLPVFSIHFFSTCFSGSPLFKVWFTLNALTTHFNQKWKPHTADIHIVSNQCAHWLNTFVKCHIIHVLVFVFCVLV